MIDVNSMQGINGADLNMDSGLSGLDLMTSIQLLLVRDFDNQLKHLGRQMKVMNQVKQKYRETIEQNQQLMLRESHDDKNPKVHLTPQEYQDILLNNDEIIGHAQDMRLEVISKTYDPKDSEGKSIPLGEFNKDGNYYEVEKSKIETKVSNKNLKLDTLNEQSEQLSLKLQSLTNKRKTAFETASNIIRKETETMGTFVRNLVG